MKNRRYYLFILIIAFIFDLAAEIPEGYYDEARGNNGVHLKRALYNIIKDHKEYPYTSNNTDTWDILKGSDQDLENPADVILIYTGWSVDAEQEYNEGEGWTREHIWPKSHGDFGITMGTGTDVHNLRPCETSVNTARSNKDFDNGGAFHHIATECRSTTETWEPRDAVKGDVARAVFYMAVRYEGEINGEPDLELVDMVNTEGPTLGKLSTLINWNQQDPVDNFERNRNEVIFGYQNNRNPFIDHHEYADSIWGNGTSPVILSINHIPSEPMASDSVQVKTKIVDSGEIAKAQLHWVYDGNASGIADMEEETDDYYTAKIPPYPAGDTVYYHITVEDGDGNTTNSLEYKYEVKESLAKTTLLNETFDSDLGAMHQYSVSGSQEWFWDDYRGSNPDDGYAKMSGYDNGEYENEDWLITPCLDLLDFDKLMLQFDEAINYDDNFVGYDQNVWISIDYKGTGNPRDFGWEKLEIEDRSSGSSWDFVSVNEVEISEVTIDDSIHAISSLDSVYIGFRYTSSNSSASTWEVDNIKVTGLQDTSSTNRIKTASMLSSSFELRNNYPNPFNSSTIIEYYIGKRQFVKLDIFDITGREIESLVKSYKSRGLHKVRWQAITQSSGIYFIKLSAKEQTKVRRCLLIK